MSLSVYTKKTIKFIWIGPLVYDIEDVKLVDMPSTMVGNFLWVLRFPPPIKLTATIWPKYLKVLLNIKQSNPIRPLDKGFNIIPAM